MPSGWIVFAVLPGAEHEIADPVIQDGLLPLPLVERVDQREGLVVLLAERTDGSAVERVRGRLRRGQARRHHVGAPDHGDVDREVMAAELDHPRRGLGRRTEEGDVDSSAPNFTHRLQRRGLVHRRVRRAGRCPRPTPGRARSSAGPPGSAWPPPGGLQDFITVDDLGRLLR